MKQVAVVGTQGVPASYGGFETLVENIIGENCPSDIRYTIFCSSRDSAVRMENYKGCRLKYIPLHANGMQSILYDIWSLIRVIRGYDVILVLGTSGCSFLPVFRLFCRKRLIVNIDGLEHRRAKWGSLARRVLRFSEAMAVRFADVVIADNKGIQDYVHETYRKEAELIAYGGDHVYRDVPEEVQAKHLATYGLTPGRYAITVCRIEPENNCHVTLEAFAHSGKKLVFIGNWDRSAYGRDLKSSDTATIPTSSCSMPSTIWTSSIRCGRTPGYTSTDTAPEVRIRHWWRPCFRTSDHRLRCGLQPGDDPESGLLFRRCREPAQATRAAGPGR